MARVQSSGGTVWSDVVEHVEGTTTVRLVMTSDPDGTVVELFEGGGPRLMFVGITCSDVERSVKFYSELGFAEVLRVHSEPQNGGHLRLEGPVVMDEVLMSAPGGGEVMLMLGSFRSRASASPNTADAVPVGVRRPANALGMWRTALLVPDLDGACAVLAALGVEMVSDPVSMAMGPGLPELRFVCAFGPDGEVVELIESPT